MRETILVVDDEEAVRRLVSRALAAGGFNAVEAVTPRVAVATVEDGLTIDLLVTDVMMPEIGGRELAWRLMDRHPKLPVLFISGQGAPDLIDNSNPRVRFLAKPFQICSLMRAVTELLVDCHLDARQSSAHFRLPL